MSLTFMRNDDVLTVIVGGSDYSVRSDHPQYGKLVKAVHEGDTDNFLANVNQAKTAEEFIATSPVLNGKVELINDEVLFEGKPVHNSLSRRIVEFKEAGLPFLPLLRFMEKLYSNPSSRAVNELFDFLQHRNLPITDDGNFQAYKKVRGDYYSVTSGSLKLIQGNVNAENRVFNGVGETIECRRNEVDDNRDHECSYGLHIGTLGYAGPQGHFKNRATGEFKTVIVEINPTDVIAVPKDFSSQKARVCKYIVVQDYVEPLSDTMVNGTNEQSRYDDEEDIWYETYEDEDEDDDYDGDGSDSPDNDFKTSSSIKVEQIRVGDSVEFTYITTRENRRRFLFVDSTSETNVYGILSPDDPKFLECAKNYRNFTKSFMSDVTLWE